MALQKIFAGNMNWLAQCDLFVAEVTGSSFGLGFETGYLLGATAKKTLFFLSGTRSAGFLSSSLVTHTRTAYWHRTPISGNWMSWLEARVRCSITHSERPLLSACYSKQAHFGTRVIASDQVLRSNVR